MRQNIFTVTACPYTIFKVHAKESAMKNNNKISDTRKMLRIFATSGLYRPEKSDGYYEGTAIKAIKDTTGRYNVKPKTLPSAKPTNGSGKGGK